MNRNNNDVINKGIFVLLLVFAVSVRLAVIALYPKVNRDSLLFLRIAEGIANGRTDVLSHCTTQPLYPLLISALYYTGVPLNAAGYFINIVCSIVLIICSYFIVYYLLKSQIAAFLSMFLCAMHPTYVEINTLILRDSLYIALFSLFILVEIRYALYAQKKDIAVLGICCGLAPWIRNEGIELLGYAVLFFSGLILYKRKHSETSNESTFSLLKTLLFLSGFLFSLFFAAAISSHFGFEWFRNFSHLRYFFSGIKQCII